MNEEVSGPPHQTAWLPIKNEWCHRNYSSFNGHTCGQDCGGFTVHSSRCDRPGISLPVNHADTSWCGPRPGESWPVKQFGCIMFWTDRESQMPESFHYSHRWCNYVAAGKNRTTAGMLHDWGSSRYTSYQSYKQYLEDIPALCRSTTLSLDSWEIIKVALPG